MKKIVIWGATGQSIVLEEFLNELGYKIIALFDNRENLISSFADVPIFYGINGFRLWKKNINFKKIFFLVAIGGVKGKDRIEISNFLEDEGLHSVSVIHPKSFVAKNAIINYGCQILASTSICARTILGKATIVNTSASIDHECVVGDGVHVGPGAKLSGCVKVGNYSFIGTGAIVLPRVVIGKNTIIGAGSVVTKDIPDNVVAYGNPARIVRSNNE